MDLINGLQTFIRVVETGSFSAVAREDNSSQSAVTRQVAQLEEHFGVRLFHRTTRKLSLTDEGQDLVGRARHLLEEAEDLEDTFGKDGGSPTGLVRIGIPVGAAILMVPEFTALLSQLSRAWPWNWWSASRWTIWSPNGWISRCGSASRRIPRWCRARWPPLGPPRSPRRPIWSAMARRSIRPTWRSTPASFTNVGPDSTHWVFTGPDGPVDVEVAGPFRSNNSLIVRQAATAGYGIALLGDPLTINDIRAAGCIVCCQTTSTQPAARSSWSIRHAGIWRSGPASSSTS